MRHSKTVVITQSNYLPWRGYFDLLRSADEVILLDSVQYTRRDWRNRNRIKTSTGPAWLTVAVEAKGRYEQSIDETRIADPSWCETHVRSIEHAYRRAASFEAASRWLFPVMRSVAHKPLLSRVNEDLLREFCERLGFAVKMTRCTDVLPRDELRLMEPTTRLLSLAKARGATCYLSGPAAKAYLDVERFNAEGIEVAWMDYAGYPDYRQLWGSFEPSVSIVDLFMNMGDEALNYVARRSQ
ncbi:MULTISPECIES: WbqC family protein [unclassified Aureimonas]|uniref:WbqC family protein n=1 Tax=unclassified Aureimonas TaxID=2615206 RepID=UPI000701FB27|nr:MULTISPECIES: WbqC family protein [unclassified Aureimonas]KQT58709.1 hypothetical protein ASG62_24480 [Aureimonas sp. Leaf427]KQT63955.1 hypothetical protein ASG54_22885 [Aureimonas sp. Leaf460]